MIVVNLGGFRLVHRHLVIIDAQPVTMGIRIGQHAVLQHLVRAEADAGHDVGRLERRLLDLGEVVLRVAVQLQLADLDQRIVARAARPWSGRTGSTCTLSASASGITWTYSVHFGNSPRLIASIRSRVEIIADPRRSSWRPRRRSKFLMPCCGLEVELDPEPLAVGVPEAVGMAAVTVHEARGNRACRDREYRIITWWIASGDRLQ